MQFQQYRKTTLTHARRLTEQDYQMRGGTIQTIHGPATFRPGDYLGRDAKDEYPIHCETLEQNYCKVSGEDADGFASYEPQDIREAVQMHKPFEANGVRGKPGDYLLRQGNRTWPVDREIFESSYALVASNMQQRNGTSIS